MKSLFFFITSYVCLCVCQESEVNLTQCPGLNEYYDCGGACDNVCETLHTMNQTHCPIVNFKCNEMCYCKEGYARDANNICVPFKECQKKVSQDKSLSSVSCGENEVFKECTCPPDTCVSLVSSLINCGPCVPGCACRKGYLRLTDGTCRPKGECLIQLQSSKSDSGI